jgi:predicted nuclease of predicted toxin-antitoxin system
MCVDVRVAQWLSEQGYNASHLHDEGLQRHANGDIFKKAISEQRTILTFDLDFSEIAALSKQKKISVIVFRLNNTRVTHVIDRLSRILPV